eukprot:g79366.t1
MSEEAEDAPQKGEQVITEHAEESKELPEDGTAFSAAQKAAVDGGEHKGTVGGPVVKGRGGSARGGRGVFSFLHRQAFQILQERGHGSAEEDQNLRHNGVSLTLEGKKRFGHFANRANKTSETAPRKEIKKSEEAPAESTEQEAPEDTKKAEVVRGVPRGRGVNINKPSRSMASAGMFGRPRPGAGGMRSAIASHLGAEGELEVDQSATTARGRGQQPQRSTAPMKRGKMHADFDEEGVEEVGSYDKEELEQEEDQEVPRVTLVRTPHDQSQKKKKKKKKSEESYGAVKLLVAGMRGDGKGLKRTHVALKAGKANSPAMDGGRPIIKRRKTNGVIIQ